MMKQEFEELAGYEVSDTNYYNIIEPMYMATNLDKRVFVKTLDKKFFALKPLDTIVKEMKKLAKTANATCIWNDDLRDEMLRLANEYTTRKYGETYKCRVFEKINCKAGGCYVPDYLDIYNRKSYNTIEKIEF